MRGGGWDGRSRLSCFTRSFWSVGVGHREERYCAGPEGERRNRNKSVCRVNVAAKQEPGDEGAEPTAAEAPFVQLVEVAAPPVGRRKAEPGDEAEQQDEYLYGRSSSVPWRSYSVVIRSEAVSSARLVSTEARGQPERSVAK
jgi:hypothetical protein